MAPERSHDFHDARRAPKEQARYTDLCALEATEPELQLELRTCPPASSRQAWCTAVSATSGAGCLSPAGNDRRPALLSPAMDGVDRVQERRRAAALARHYRDQEGLPIAEIARRLGRAEATVKAYLYDPSYPNKRPTHSPTRERTPRRDARTAARRSTSRSASSVLRDPFGSAAPRAGARLAAAAGCAERTTPRSRAGHGPPSTLLPQPWHCSSVDGRAEVTAFRLALAAEPDRG